MTPLDQKVGIIGLGSMGTAVASRLLASGLVPADGLRATCLHEDSAQRAATALGIECGTDNGALSHWADILLIAVKPHDVLSVLRQVAYKRKGDLPLVLSAAAGVRLESMEMALGERSRVIRAMANTPCLVGEGLTVLSPGTRADTDDLALARRIFETTGRVLELPEKHLDVVTALSASGVAFILTVIDALADGAVSRGLPRAVAIEIALQMTRGSAALAQETGRTPADLRDDVTTPGGCTIEGLLALERGGLRAALADAIRAATDRAAGLG